MKMAEMKITIMPDGKIKVITDSPIPEELHQNADEFIDFLHNKAGGERVTDKLHEGHVHNHEHVHEHEMEHQHRE